MNRRGVASAIAVAVIAAAWAAGCGRLAQEPKNVTLEDLGSCQVGLVPMPPRPAAGENTMTIVVKDASRHPVSGATVEIAASMPAMGAMPYMESRGEVREAAAGVYRATYGLPMAGEWELNVVVRPHNGAPARGTWRVSTNLDGAAFSGGSAPSAGAATADSAARAGAAAPPGAAGDAASAVTIDPARRQSLGIQVAPVAERDLVAEIRASGRVAYDETRITEVSPRLSGWVRAIHADFIGQLVRRGEVLFEIYSPDLWAAQQEYLAALAAARADSSEHGPAADLADAARRRLSLWDLGPADIESIERSGRPRENFPVRAPVSGVITDKSVVLGSPVTAGQMLYRIAPTDPVWVLASLYEQDLPLVRIGTPVRLTAPGAGAGGRAGRVAFIAPDLAADTRTGTARIEVRNGDGALKPGMYLDALMRVALGRRLAVPESAVLPTGTRRIVFVDLGDGRLAPRDVTLGARAGDWYEVRGGLTAGERVVVSGNFLVAAESRLRSATGKW